MILSLQVVFGFVAIALMAVGAQAQEGNFERFMVDLMTPKILDSEYANVEKKVLYTTSWVFFLLYFFVGFLGGFFFAETVGLRIIIKQGEYVSSDLEFHFMTMWIFFASQYRR